MEARPRTRTPIMELGTRRAPTGSAAARARLAEPAPASPCTHDARWECDAPTERCKPLKRWTPQMQERPDAMRCLRSIPPLVILLVLLVLLEPYAASVAPLPVRVDAAQRGTSDTRVTPPDAACAQAPAASTRTAMPVVVSLTATPQPVAPLDRVTIIATLFNGGFACGPYRATLQLLPAHSNQLRSSSQSGFMLRHGRRLTLAWEWRAGASLPPGQYRMRLQLATVARPARVLPSYTSGQQLTILPD